jgi:alpha-L-rhamnosidase
LYISAKGLFEAQINGKKVGNDVLVPGFTPYKKRIETLSYDVSKYINNKTNTIGIILGEGWYSGRLAWAKDLWPPKPRPKAICQLEITYDNGEKEIIISDDNWRGTRNGPIRFSGIYDGEVYDANLEITNWSTPNFNDTYWEKVKSYNLDSSIQLVPKSHQAVTNKEELPTLTISNVGSGRFIFDLGQNMVGVPLIKMPVIKDQTVTIRFAEMLNQDGTLYTDNYRNAKSIDFYTPKANAEISYLPKFTFHGFRYVELSGFDASKQPDKSWVTGIVQYSDFEATGTFTSSHEKLNKLQKNISWGLKGNLVDIPTDCPQRDERLGWTGDAQVITPTSIFNNHMHAFWASWLKSMREEQGKSGNIPVVIPNVLFDPKKGDMSSRFSTSSGWSDAATIVPWEVYFRTGDTKILRDNYEMMKGLLDFYKSMSSNHIVEMFTFGDWLQPHRENNGSSSDTKPELINTAYYARSIDITMKTAEVLGNKKDANNLKVLRDSVRVAFETEFIDDEGKLTTEYETQTGYLMALGFDLVTEETAQKILPHLIRKIKDADNHLRTGFLGTPLLATVLSKYNRADLMYTLLFKETYPSWFFSINQGATTMWERWNSYSHKDGFGDAGMNSFNHYAYGAIGQFMYECIAGINPLEPGYKKILIAPMPGEMLEHAKAEYNSLYGKISSAWKKIDNGLELDVTIPPNTSGKIVIPIREGQSVTLYNKEIANNTDVKVIEKNDTNIVLAVMPGSYEFCSH